MCCWQLYMENSAQCHIDMHRHQQTAVEAKHSLTSQHLEGAVKAVTVHGHALVLDERLYKVHRIDIQGANTDSNGAEREVPANGAEATRHFVVGVQVHVVHALCRLSCKPVGKAHINRFIPLVSKESKDGAELSLRKHQSGGASKVVSTNNRTTHGSAGGPHAVADSRQVILHRLSHHVIGVGVA